MKKSISILLIMFIIISYLAGSIFSSSVYAGTGEDFFSEENIINITKGIAVLYLFHHINNLMNSADNSIEKQDSNNLIGNNSSRKVIVIDPGHGGYDPGAIGPEGLKEKDVNLNIALKLREFLEKNTEASIHLTRNKDVFVSLEQRVSIARRLNADIFISIHCNADENGTEEGIETYAYYDSPPAAWALAWYLQESLVQELKLQDRGLKADNFQVIRELTDINSVLLEIAFISNKREETLLANENTTVKAARAIYNGILNFCSSP